MADRNPRETPMSKRMRELAPRVARFWWIGFARGLIAIALGVSVLFASGSPARIATFLALYWLFGGIVTIRFALVLRPGKGFRLAIVAGVVAVTAAMLVLIRAALSGVVTPVQLINVLGLAAVAMGALRLVGAFELERRTGRRWTIGGLVMGCLEIGTGILLIANDTQSSGVVITVCAWSLASGTLLIVEALRVHRLAVAADEGGAT